MAGHKRITQPARTMPRTIERIAIAALAAIAARGSGESLAAAAVAIFIIVVVIEELGRHWIWYGKKVTLRDVALGSIGDLRLRRAAARVRGKRRKRRVEARARRSEKIAGQGHAQG